MKKHSGFWDYYKFKIIILVVGLIIIGTICFYSIIAHFFFVNNPNGELLKVLITIVGGSAVFIGLMLNSDRIKAQTEQNTISETSNFDKRFSDAIGYLGEEKTSIVLGGIYALYQLAKEDKRYKSIVAGLFTSYLRDKSAELYQVEYELNQNKESTTTFFTTPKVPITIKTIVDLLFNNKEFVFIGESLDLTNTIFNGITFENGVRVCNFKHSKFESCQFLTGVYACQFDLTNIKNCQFGSEDSGLANCTFFGAKIYSSSFIGDLMCKLIFELTTINYVTIDVNRIIECDFSIVNFEGPLIFKGVSSITDTQISDNQLIKYEECTNSD